MPVHAPGRRGKKAASIGSAIALAAALTISSGAMGAPGSLDPLPRLANGAVDFSGWTAVTSSYGTHLATDEFERNGVSYQVEIVVPSNTNAPLFANTILNRTDGLSHTYSFINGDASTSGYWITYGGTRDRLTSGGCIQVAYYSGELQGAPVGAKERECSVGGTTLRVSEVIRLTADGRIVHDVTLTNVGTAQLAGFSFGVNLDTMLDSEDWIPIIKSTANAAYIENDDFRLYLAATTRDRVLVGSWTDRSDLENWVNLADFRAGDVAVDHTDSAIEYQLVNRTLAPGASASLAFEERVFAAAEIQPGQVEVKLVDDDASGAAVQPTDPEAAQLNGEPLTEVGFTQEDAEALVPAGYELVSIDPALEENDPLLYDGDNSTTQEIVLHLVHIHTLGQVTATRTITYEGAGDLTPPAVVQTQTVDTDKDEVTGVTTYANGSGYPAVVSPEVEGYWPLTAVVPAVGASTSAEPQNLTVTVRYVTDEPQLAIASEHGVEGGTATVSGADSFDPRGGELALAWDLDNDGEYDDATGPEATLSLPLVGSHTVGLQATDALGRVSTSTFAVQAANVVPVVDIGADVQIKADGVFQRNGSFTDPGADTWTGEVDYGDGTAVQALRLNGKAFVLDHKYLKAGKYTVTVRIKDVTAGSTGVATIQVTVPQGLAVTGPQDLAPAAVGGGTLLLLGLALVLRARRNMRRLTV
ncbi:MAG: hypothetical protein LBC97_05670 [Bifidobacteriaceae bacterium]|jgi:hypothetical protein|nr:hypothetical protein [Bifidobacteriaceae bacterium]